LGRFKCLVFLPLLLTSNNRNNLDDVAPNGWLPTMKEFIQIIVTFGLTTVAWIFFRAETITDALLYIQGIFDWANFMPATIRHKKVIPLLFLFLVVEWFSRKQEYAIVLDKKYRMVFYILFAFMILYYGSVEEKSSFIYFQF